MGSNFRTIKCKKVGGNKVEEVEEVEGVEG